jgi:hypothetical protein
MGKRFRRAKRQSAPHRVLFRFLSGGKSLPTKKTVTARLARRFGPKPVARQSQANHDRMMAGKRPLAGKAAAKKAPARKTAAPKRKPSVYDDAKKIPERNRAAAAGAAKKAAAAPRSRGSKPVRLANGQFNGREAMNPRDREQFERLERRAEAPAAQMRPLVRRRTR